MITFSIFSGAFITIQDCEVTELGLSELDQNMLGGMGNLDHIFPRSASHGKRGYASALAQRDSSFKSLCSELSG